MKLPTSARCGRSARAAFAHKSIATQDASSAILLVMPRHSRVAATCLSILMLGIRFSLFHFFHWSLRALSVGRVSVTPRCQESFALLTPIVGTTVEILRCAQDDSKEVDDTEFGIWTLTRAARARRRGGHRGPSTPQTPSG